MGKMRQEVKPVILVISVCDNKLNDSVGYSFFLYVSPIVKESWKKVW